MRDYKRAFNCIDYLIKFVDSIDNPSRGASNIMIDKQGETIMKTDLGYWYEGNEQLREYLRKKSVEENEIKAIPIEWILNYRKNNQGEITYYTIDAIDHMLCEWCKRNNIDMWNMIDSWEKENE